MTLFVLAKGVCFLFLLEMLVDCITEGTPFPAFETFDYKKTLPKRFFLFYDVFFQAGRHNPEIWRAAIGDDVPITSAICMQLENTGYTQTTWNNSN